MENTNITLSANYLSTKTKTFLVQALGYEYNLELDDILILERFVNKNEDKSIVELVLLFISYNFLPEESLKYLSI